MDSSHYQIHTSRVIPQANVKVEFLSCFICKNILWQPEKCRECHTHFCRFCIVFSLLKSKKCPCCCNEYFSKTPDTFLIQDLNDLYIKCFYTYNGCSQSLKYTEILSHEIECIYKEQTCEECNKKILKKNYHTHIVLCKNSVPLNIKIDYPQVLNYFKDKLEKVEKENLEDIEKIKKAFQETLMQKDNILQNLLTKMEKQTRLLEEIAVEKEKRKSLAEEELKLIEFATNQKMIP